MTISFPVYTPRKSSRVSVWFAILYANFGTLCFFTFESFMLRHLAPDKVHIHPCILVASNRTLIFEILAYPRNVR